MITITATIRDRNGDPDPDGQALFELMGGALIDDDANVVPKIQYADADANGQISVDLEPNVGPENSHYRIQFFSSGQQMLYAELSLTASGDIEDLL